MEKPQDKLQGPLTPAMVWVGGGVVVGALIGYLLRPSVWLVGQLPFSTVITRGANLQGMDQLLVSAAQTSFNYLLIGAIVGGALGFVAATMTNKKTTS